MRDARYARLALAVLLLGWLLAWLPATVIHAQTAAPEPGAVAAAVPSVAPGDAASIETGDPRSDGQGPGLVGEPLLVLVGIVLIGVATVVITVGIARATGRA